MSPSEILAAVTGTGGALAVLLVVWWTFLTGRAIPGVSHREVVADKDRQISALTQALAAERTRADAGVLAAMTTNQVLSALHREVTGR